MASRKTGTERTNFRLPEDLQSELRVRKERGEGSMNSIVIRAVRQELEGRGHTIVVKPDASLQLRLAMLPSLPCGPLSEAIEGASRQFVVSEDVREALDIRRSDFVAYARGQSMTGTAMPEGEILDSDLLVFRALRPGNLPNSREIALVQTVTDDGVASVTVKRWHNTEPPHLTDGNGKEVPLPEEGQLVPVGIVRGLIRKF